MVGRVLSLARRGSAGTGTAFSSVVAVARFFALPPRTTSAADLFLKSRCLSSSSFIPSSFVFSGVLLGAACCVGAGAASALALPQGALRLVSLFSASVGGFVGVPGRAGAAAKFRVAGMPWPAGVFFFIAGMPGLAGVSRLAVVGGVVVAWGRSCMSGCCGVAPAGGGCGCKPWGGACGCKRWLCRVGGGVVLVFVHELATGTGGLVCVGGFAVLCWCAAGSLRVPRWWVVGLPPGGALRLGPSGPAGVSGNWVRGSSSAWAAWDKSLFCSINAAGESG